MSPEDTAARMFELATEIAQRHVTTYPHHTPGTDKTWTYVPAVSRDGLRVQIRVPQNGILDKQRSRDMLTACRKDVVDAFLAEGLAVTAKKQRVGRSGKTWVYHRGYWHMGIYHVTDRWCTFTAKG